MSRWPCPSGVAAESGPFSRWTTPGTLVPILAAAMIFWSCSLEDPIRATREFALSAAAEGVSTIEVHNRVGAIRVKGYDGADVQVQVLVKVRAASDDARQGPGREGRGPVRAGRQDAEAFLTAAGPGPAMSRSRWSWTSRVPWRRAGGGAAAATTNPASARAVVCQMVVGVLEVREVAAAIRADITTGVTKIEDVCGPVEVESGTGTIHVSGADDKVMVTSGTGDVTVADVRGQVHVSAAVGRIEVRNVKPSPAGVPSTMAVWVHVSTGYIRIQDVTGDVQATTSTGRVKVTDVRGTVDAHSAIGEVTLDHIEGPPGKS